MIGETNVSHFGDDQGEIRKVDYFKPDILSSSNVTASQVLNHDPSSQAEIKFAVTPLGTAGDEILET
jgi:hypothetical protein